MSDAAVPLDPCGCCDEASPAVSRANRAGLSAVVYRAGTHGRFLADMLARLPRWTLPSGPREGARPLAALGTRDAADPTVALLDAWACLADVLTFYQERIANEGWLRTATERRSVLELARAIGYELKPGVAAAAHLAVTVEDAPGAPAEATIPVGMRVLSVPGAGERPQVFETAEALHARAEWNAMRPRATRPQDLGAGTRVGYFRGLATQLQPADVVLLVGAEREAHHGSERWDLRVVETVTPVPARNHTVVTWRPGLGERPVAPAAEPRAYVFRLRAGLFGHNAAEWDALPPEIRSLYASREGSAEWPGFAIQTDPPRIDLDGSHPQILRDSWVALAKPSYVELYRAAATSVVSRTGFGLVSRVTRIVPDSREHLSWFGLRETVALAWSVELPLAEEPDGSALAGDRIELDRRVTPPPRGRTVIVSGRRKRQRARVALVLVSQDGLRQMPVAPGDLLAVAAAPEAVNGALRWTLEDRTGFVGSVTPPSDALGEEPAAADDPVASEVAAIDRVEDGPTWTILHLEEPLAGYYDRETVTIAGNVALATHGETVAAEPLGSGDGSIPHQRFVLAKPPLTHVSAATPSGTASTLEVRVDGVRWHEAPGFLGLQPGAERYVVRREDDGTTRVVFGDGVRGARLPSGAENVVARYRSGIGLAGEVPAGSLTLLQTRPFGVRGVTNPLAASGAADPEALEEARANAPVTVLTLDRIVSLRDHEDFARTFAGIGKAQAIALWNGETRVVHVTVATAGGDPVPAASTLMANLREAMDGVRDPGVPLLVQGYTRIHFLVAARLLVDARLEFEAVAGNVRATLLAAFDFAHRSFGQAVTLAEVVAVAQAIPGVVAVDVNALHRDLAAPTLETVLVAETGRRMAGVYLPAELLVAKPAGISLSEMPR